MTVVSATNAGGASARRVWLHIGHGKTGTTALQHYFAARAEVDPCFHYPTVGLRPTGAHHNLFPLESQAKMLDEVPARLKALRDAIATRSADITVLSSEHLCYFRPWQVAQVTRALADCDLRLLYFVRRQDELMESAFRWQLIGPGGDRIPDPEAFVAKSLKAFDFLERLAPWRSHLSDDAISVRLYHRETCAGDIVTAAEDAMELAPVGVAARSGTRRRSLGPAMTRVLIAYDRLHGGNPARAAFIDRLTEIDVLAGSLQGPDLIPDALKREIMARYAASNRTLAETFLAEDEANILLHYEV